MSLSVSFAVASLFVGTVLTAAAQQIPAPASDPAAKFHAAAALENRPLPFDQNLGQAPASIQYLARTSRYTAYLNRDRVLFAVHQKHSRDPPTGNLQHPQTERSPVLTMTFARANPQSRPTAEDPLASHSNYFHGRSPTDWQINVPQSARVVYHAVYPDIDVAYHGTAQDLEYDFLLAPFADPTRIALAFTGQNHLAIDHNGDLALNTGAATMLLKRPIAYQTVHGARRDVEASYLQRSNHTIAIRLGTYDHSLPMVIDPKLVYSTYLGGTDDEGIFGIAFDPEGNLYISGETSSLNFPAKHGPQTTVGGDYDAFVSKFDRSGSRLIYSSYLGGSAYDHAVGLAVDGNGSAYLAGITESPNFPLAHALQDHFGGRSDAFVARLSPSGSSLLFSTYLGGAGYDYANGLAIDPKGNVFVTGGSSSVDFPTTAAAVQPRCAGFCVSNAFVAKLDPLGQNLVYSTYLGGGTGYDAANAIAVDPEGAAYVTGRAGSRDFPTRNAFQPALAGSANAFMTKLDLTGSNLVFSTYLGGNSYDAGQGIALDASRNIYLTGYTHSTNFPLQHPLQSAYGGGQLDGFVTKFDRTGTKLAFSTYLGGSGMDFPFRIAVDPAGYASVIGFTASTDFPLANPTQPKYAGGAFDAFVTRLSRDGSKLAFSTYLGGSGDEYGYSITTTLTGAIWVGGSTSSTDYPLLHPFQAKYGGGPFDAFLTKFALSPKQSLEVLEAALGNLAGEHLLNPSALDRLSKDLAAADADLSAGKSFQASFHLLLFERSLAEETERGAIPANTAIELGLASYDIFQQLQQTLP